MMKLSTSVDQLCDDEGEVLITAQLSLCYESFKTKMGGRPMCGAEPTFQQVSGISSRVGDDYPPYADFAIFGSFGVRIIKKL
eukprot:1483348-Amphidinium_carterae.1